MSHSVRFDHRNNVQKKVKWEKGFTPPIQFIDEISNDIISSSTILNNGLSNNESDNKSTDNDNDINNNNGNIFNENHDPFETDESDIDTNNNNNTEYDQIVYNITNSTNFQSQKSFSQSNYSQHTVSQMTNNNNNNQMEMSLDNADEYEYRIMPNGGMKRVSHSFHAPPIYMVHTRDKSNISNTIDANDILFGIDGHNGTNNYGVVSREPSRVGVIPEEEYEFDNGSSIHSRANTIHSRINTHSKNTYSMQFYQNNLNQTLDSDDNNDNNDDNDHDNNDKNVQSQYEMLSLNILANSIQSKATDDDHNIEEQQLILNVERTKQKNHTCPNNINVHNNNYTNLSNSNTSSDDDNNNNKYIERIDDDDFDDDNIELIAANYGIRNEKVAFKNNDNCLFGCSCFSFFG